MASSAGVRRGKPRLAPGLSGCWRAMPQSPHSVHAARSTARAVDPPAARQLVLYKHRKGSRLSGGLTASRKHSPELHGRQRPVRQHGLDCSSRKFRRKHPFRTADREAETGEHRLPDTLRSTNAKSPGHSNGDLGCFIAKAPNLPAFALVVDNGLVCLQVSRSPRRAHPIEIGRRADNDRTAFGDLAGGQC